MATIYFRKLKPSGAHKSYRFQKQEDGGKWTTVISPEIDALNAELKKGKTLSIADIEVRAEAILASLYKERDKEEGVALYLPGNLKVFEEWWKKTYPLKKQKQYSPSYLPSERYYMKRALKAAGNVAIDGPIDELQEWLDETLEDDLDKHNTVCGRINRIRKWKKLSLLVPSRKERKDVAYLTKAEVEKLLAKLPEPHKTLAAVAFYTGLRRGEIFALESAVVKKDIIEVRAQLHLVSGEMRLPKNGKIRKAFIIPGGEVWVKQWLKMKGKTRVNPKTEEEELLIKPNLGISAIMKKYSGGKRFHDLRHSYAVYLISQGLSLDWVAQSLGNSRDVCERHYATHILQQDSIELMRAAFKKVEG